LLWPWGLKGQKIILIKFYVFFFQQKSTTTRNKKGLKIEETKDPTSVIKKCLELTQKVIKDFTVEDLRLMIGQEIGLEYLIPYAIIKLKENLWSEGDFYPGDLLQSILKANPQFWLYHKHFWQEIHILIQNKKTELKSRKISYELFYEVNF
jgi:hypothetical protein